MQTKCHIKHEAHQIHAREMLLIPCVLFFYLGLDSMWVDLLWMKF